MLTKEDYLKVATPEEWDRWLTEKASIYAPKNKQSSMSGSERPRSALCLFCKVARAVCVRENLSLNGYIICSICMAGRGYKHCYEIPKEEKADQAIERLEAAGLWS